MQSSLAFEVSTQPTTARRNNELRKAVEAIHSAGSLSLVANKLLNVFALNAYPNLSNCETFRISIAETSELAGFNSNNTRKLKSAARELRDTTIEWDVRDRNPEWGITSFLSEVRFYDGIIEYSIPPTVRKMFALGEGRAWALINLEVIQQIESNYSLRLYENCYRFKTTGTTGMREVAEWRLLLQANTALYDEFRYLRRKIEACIAEINKKTNITIKANYFKEGKSVRFISFDIQSKKKTRTPAVIDAVSFELIDNPIIFQRLLDLGVTEVVARDYFESYEPSYLEGNLDVVEARFNDGVVKNVTGYLQTALIKDFRILKPKKVIEAEKAKEIQTQLDACAEQENQARQYANKARSLQARERFDGLDSDEQDHLIELFTTESQQSYSFMYPKIIKSGVNGALVSPVFSLWLADKFQPA